MAKKKVVSGIDCWCLFDEAVNIKDLMPNPKNPNIHPDRQIEMLAENIEEEGWRHPITVSNRSGMIVYGHGRLMAARLMGVKKAPVAYQDFTETAEGIALIADNKIPELSITDNELMTSMLLDPMFNDVKMSTLGIEAQSAFDPSLTPGIKMVDVAGGDVDKAEAGKAMTSAEQETVEVICPNCLHEFEVK